MTTERAAASIRGSHSKISRMEHGRVSFKERDIASLLTLYGVAEGPEREALLKLADEANTPGWRQASPSAPVRRESLTYATSRMTWPWQVMTCHSRIPAPLRSPLRPGAHNPNGRKFFLRQANILYIQEAGLVHVVTAVLPCAEAHLHGKEAAL